MLTLIAAALLAQIAAAPSTAARGNYVLVEGDSINSHTEHDVDEEALRDRYGRHFFWYELGDRRYVVVDRAALDDIHELFEPQRKLGRQQSELGRRQAELGRQQAEYGREQARLGQEQARLASDSYGRERMRELGDQMRAEGDKMRALGDRMRDLGDQMRDLGDQMRQ